jgi:tetratricopeptide (TPR) repeat protein
VIAATLQGRHQDAVRLGERVLSKRPKFLPVLRHLFASYAALGDHEKAREAFRLIRESEPSFGTPAMYAEDYARTYSTTIRLIETGLRDVGLIGNGGGASGQGEGG